MERPSLKGSISFLRQVRDLLFPFARTRSIDVLLAQASPTAPLNEKIVWLQDVVEWLRSPIEAEEKASIKARGGRIQTVRIRFLLHLLDRNPVWKTNVSLIFRSALMEASGLELFSSTGLARESAFFSEAMNRLMRLLLPAPANERELASLFIRIFHNDTDPEWIENLPTELLDRILDLIRYEAKDPDAIFTPLKTAMAEALLILGPNIAAMGLSEELRSRMSDGTVGGSPFRALNRSLSELSDQLRAGKSLDPLDNPLGADCDGKILACREKITDVYRHLEESGVSVALVFRLETLAASLNRVETLLRILIPHPSVDRTSVGRRFLVALVRQSLDATGFRRLIGDNMDMIARKVVERVGLSGEHYITSNRLEYWQMLRAGAGGGLVTVFTTIIKFAIGKASMPLFFDGLFSAINYAGSFLLMQFAHFALATKQPSMTASALAGKLRLLSHRRHLQEFVDEVTKITRSQFAAAVGNVGLVIPGALFFDWTFRQLAGRPVLDAKYALATVQSFDPFTSLTIPAAALTGVLLWFSAVTGGWVENWAVFRKLPEAIGGHRRLRLVFGDERTQKFAAWFQREIAGIASCIAIGFYLAFTPVIGRFFGAPLDVRHITLSSGALTFAVSSIGWETLDKQAFAFACLGIVLILILNFGVSFSLALFVALRARRIKRAWVLHLIQAVTQRMLNRGWQFIYPPKENPLAPKSE